MYKFIKILFHIDPVISHVAYLYQDITTHKYYLSHTPFTPFNISNADFHSIKNN